MLKRVLRPSLVSIPLKSGHWFNGKRIGPIKPVLRLNPFEIRALVQYVLKSNELIPEKVSIPLKSGHWFNVGAYGMYFAGGVSIPLKSGHWFNS